MSATPTTAPRYRYTICSQCGQSLGAGSESFSRCSDHEAAAIEQDRSIARAKDSGVYDRVRDNAALRDQIQYSGSAL